MYATERQGVIERRLRSEGRVGVVALSREFNVTTETVRRDLDALERSGALRRVHGGAIAVDRVSTIEPTVAERDLLRGAEKERIAQRAVDVLGERFRGSLYLDAGTTTGSVARLLAGRVAASDVEIVTHAVPHAQSLALLDGMDVTLIGGRIRGVTAASVGAGTVHAIEGLRPDIAFVGTNALSADFGLSTPDPDEAAVKTAIVRSARRLIVVADQTKFDRDSLVSFARLDDIDLLVTDAAPAGELAEALVRADVEVLVA